MIPFLVLACKLKFLIDHFCNTQEYADFLQEFMTAVKQNYGEKVLIQVKHYSEKQYLLFRSRFVNRNLRKWLISDLKKKSDILLHVLLSRSLRILPTIMPLSSLQDMAQLTLYSMMISR